METTAILTAGDWARTEGFDWATRKSFFYRYGVHSQAFNALQPDMEYFDVPGVGYLAHRSALGSRFVLGDPVAAPEEFCTLLDAFLIRYPGSLFLQCSQPVMAHLHQAHGFYGTQVGIEAKVPLATWTTSGSSKKSLRTAWNQAAVQGIEVREGEIDSTLLTQISERWLETRSMGREIRFVIRPAHAGFQEGVRRFYAYQTGQAIGFIYFDPIYLHDRIIGYIPNVSRASPSFKHGLWYVMMLHAMNVFRAEGVEYVDLGHTPLTLDENLEPQESRPLRWALELFRDRGARLYNFAGLRFTKERFGGAVEKTYLGHRNRLPLLAVPSLLRLCGVF